MSDIGELLARLEAASEGSAEFDGLIVSELKLYDMCTREGAGWLKAPSFTQSVDAALMLVPEEVVPFLMVGFGTPAKAGAHDGNRDYRYFEGATPALALCILSFKYRLASLPLPPEAGDG